MDPNSLNFLPGQVFGHYRVVAELARGGQGLVLRAQHAQGAMVALKVLLRAEGPAFRRFQREVDVLARLNHPNLPRILDTGMIQGHPFVAMQLVEGGSLAHRLKHRGPLPIEEAVEILDEIAKVLEYCHSLGVYHRDLKPGNVVVDQASGRPFLETQTSPSAPRPTSTAWPRPSSTSGPVGRPSRERRPTTRSWP